MSNQTQTLNQKISASIYGTNKLTSLKVADAQAASAEIAHTLKALEEDSKALASIQEALNVRSPEQLAELRPNTCLTQTTEQLLRSYLILLAIVIMSSPSADFSNTIRARFYHRSLVADPSKVSLSPANAEALDANFLNLLEIHGPFVEPTWWDNFVAKIKAYFAK